LFDFLRCQRRSDGIDLHLDRRHVREGIDVESGQGETAKHHEDQGDHNHEETVAQRPLNDAVEHRRSSPGSAQSLSPSSPRRSSDLRAWLPFVTTSSPGARPARTSVNWPPCSPQRTWRTWKSVSETLTKTR